jgi:hypothetical protein
LRRLPIAPEFPKCLDGYFLCACGVANHPYNGAGNSFVMNVKEGLEIESVVGYSNLNRLAWRIHII